MPLSDYTGLLWFAAGIISTISVEYLRKLHEKRKELKDEIYSDLYDELVEVCQDGLTIPNRTGPGIFLHKWDEFQPNERLQVDDSLEDKLDTYREKTEELSELLDLVEITVAQKGPDEEVLTLVDNHYHFVPEIAPESETQRRARHMRPSDWLSRYGDFLFNSDGPTDLYQNILRFDRRSQVGPKSSQFWTPEHYTVIWDAYTEAQEAWLESRKYDSVDELATEIETDAAEIKEMLEKKLNYSWIDPRF